MSKRATKRLEQTRQNYAASQQQYQRQSRDQRNTDAYFHDMTVTSDKNVIDTMANDVIYYR